MSGTNDLFSFLFSFAGELSGDRRGAQRNVLVTWLGLLRCLLVVELLICGQAHSQTADPLNVSSAQTSGSSPPLIYAVIPQPDGKLLVGGGTVKFFSPGTQSRTNLARLASDGTLDESFNATVVSDSAVPAVTCIALQTNRQILIGGSFSRVNGQLHYDIARLNQDGSLDTQFDAGLVDTTVHGLLVQPDGKVLVCGGFTKIHGQACRGLCRLNADGSQDNSFNAAANGSVCSLALQPDGRIVVAGSFTSIGGQARTNLARLNATGSLDSSLQPIVLTFDFAWAALSLQPDGRILTGGVFTKVNGVSHTNIVRFNQDGTLDPNFVAQAERYNCYGLQAFALQTDGEILIGHDSPTINGHPCPYLSRLNADGTLDPNFKTNLVSGALVFSCAGQQDGRILVGGYFSTLAGATCPSLGRLINTGAATQDLQYDGTNITWLRGGTSPEVWRTSFEWSTNSVAWSYLGDGARISGGWQLTNVSAPTNAVIRARGFATGGEFNGSSWFVESTCPQAAPQIVLDDGNCGFQNHQFGFNVRGSAGATVVINASTNLLDWKPIATNMLNSAPLCFRDPGSTNSPAKFYSAVSGR